MSRRRVSVFLLLLPFGSAACGTSESFEPPPVDAPFTNITVGALHSCATTTTARAYCWGWNRDGQLGDGSRSDRAEPVRVTPDTALETVAGGGGHSCAIDRAGTASCWGFNLSGQLGVQEAAGGVVRSAAPVPVAGGLTLTTVEAGGAFTCGVAADSTAWCWGWGALGQLGDGGRVDRRTPVRVGGGLRPVSVSGGARHTCALAADSTAWCWGANGAGQLGNGTVTDTTLPVAVAGSRRFIAVGAGNDHTCALEATGDMYCWGDNAVGQLGDTVVSQTSTPHRVLGGHAFTSLTAGAAHTCAVSISGAGYCWGGNASGQVGSQSLSVCATPSGSQPCTRTPALLSGGLTLRTISAGTQHTCGLSPDGVAFCWGLNDRGQLGDGSTHGSATPVRVANQAGP